MDFFITSSLIGQLISLKDAGREGFRAAGMQDWRNARKERGRKRDATHKVGRIGFSS